MEEFSYVTNPDLCWNAWISLLLYPIGSRRQMSVKALLPFSHSPVFARLAGISTGLLGASVLLGWFLKNEMLKSIIPGAPPMKPNMAAGFLLCGAALAILSSKMLSKPVRICAMAMAATVVVLAALTLGEHFLAWDLPIEQWLIGNVPGALETSHPGRMTSPSALGFFLAGSALVAASLSPSLQF